MSKPIRCLLAATLICGCLPAVAADEGGWIYDNGLKYRTPDNGFELEFQGRVDARFTADNPDIGERGQSFDLEHARILLDGRGFKHWAMRVQVDLAKGSLSSTESSSNLLLDGWVTYTKHRLAQVRIGQGKVGFARQFLIDSGRQQFTERSIATNRFAHGRDVGIELFGQNEDQTYIYSVGAYNGNGINKEADENRDYLVVGRLGVTPLGSVGSLTTSDVSEMIESNPDWPEDPGPKLYVGVAAMTNQVGEGSFEEERINTGAFAVAFRVRGLALMGEFFTESRDILLGLPAAETDTDGWYFQGGYAFPVSELSMLEIAGRYSEILRETADDDETEVGVALTLFIRGQRNKILAEYRRLEFEGIPLGSRIDNDIFRILYQLIF